MSTTIKCPFCKEENESAAHKCVKCGAFLAFNTTLQINSLPQGYDEDDFIPHKASLKPAQIMFFMPGAGNPIVVDAAERLFLGRNSASGDTPSVDFGAFQAHLYGVSREHAVIYPDADHYVIEDLGSTNGTFLNEKQLTPYNSYTLKSGDYLRMGHLAMVVYFREYEGDTNAAPRDKTSVLSPAASSEPHEQTFDLCVQDGTTLSRLWVLTPNYLQNTIMPYLLALAGMQAVIDELRGERPYPPIIDTISVNRAKESITVKMLGGNDALMFTKEYLLPWRQLHLEPITRYRHLQSIAQIDTLPQKERPKSPSHTDSTEQHLQDEYAVTLAEMQVRFATKLVDLVAPDSEIREHYIERLLPHLEELSMGVLEIIPR